MDGRKRGGGGGVSPGASSGLATVGLFELPDLTMPTGAFLRGFGLSAAGAGGGGGGAAFLPMAASTGRAAGCELLDESRWCELAVASSFWWCWSRRELIEGGRSSPARDDDSDLDGIPLVALAEQARARVRTVPALAPTRHVAATAGLRPCRGRAACASWSTPPASAVPAPARTSQGGTTSTTPAHTRTAAPASTTPTADAAAASLVPPAQRPRCAPPSSLSRPDSHEQG